jgi:hypothetical protein
MKLNTLNAMQIPRFFKNKPIKFQHFVKFTFVQIFH